MAREGSIGGEGPRGKEREQMAALAGAIADLRASACGASGFPKSSRWRCAIIATSSGDPGAAQGRAQAVAVGEPAPSPRSRCRISPLAWRISSPRRGRSTSPRAPRPTGGHRARAPWAGIRKEATWCSNTFCLSPDAGRFHSDAGARRLAVRVIFRRAGQQGGVARADRALIGCARLRRQPDFLKILLDLGRESQLRRTSSLRCWHFGAALPATLRAELEGAGRRQCYAIADVSSSPTKPTRRTARSIRGWWSTSGSCSRSCGRGRATRSRRARSAEVVRPGGQLESGDLPGTGATSRRCSPRPLP